VITAYEKIFHLLGHSVEHPLQAALSLSVCFAPNNMVTPLSGSSSIAHIWSLRILCSDSLALFFVPLLLGGLHTLPAAREHTIRLLAGVRPSVERAADCQEHTGSPA